MIRFECSDGYQGDSSDRGPTAEAQGPTPGATTQENLGGDNFPLLQADQGPCVQFPAQASFT